MELIFEQKSRFAKHDGYIEGYEDGYKEGVRKANSKINEKGLIVGIVLGVLSTFVFNITILYNTNIKK